MSPPIQRGLDCAYRRVANPRACYGSQEKPGSTALCRTGFAPKCRPRWQASAGGRIGICTKFSIQASIGRPERSEGVRFDPDSELICSEWPVADWPPGSADAAVLPECRSDLPEWEQCAVGGPVPIRQADRRIVQNPLDLQLKQKKHQAVPGQNTGPL